MNNSEIENNIYSFIFSRILRAYYSDSPLSKEEQSKLDKYKIQYEEIYNSANYEAQNFINFKNIDRKENLITPVRKKNSKGFIKNNINFSLLNEKNKFSIPSLPDLFKVDESKLHLSIVEGDSMVGAGINEGDLVLFTPINYIPRNSSIVLIEVNSIKFIKRIKYDFENIYLISDNPKYPPFKIDDDIDFKLIGEVIGIIKKII